MPRVAILLFHPQYGTSRVGRAMADALATLEDVTIHDVYARYPDFDIDVDAEHQLCEQHDVLVFQHPIQWYGCPSLMKEWLDRVLTYGWAHGPSGTALADKRWLSAVSAGWPEADYGRDARNGAALAEFLKPFEQSARFCGMRWLDPVIAYGARRATADDIAHYASSYRARISALRDDSAGSKS